MALLPGEASEHSDLVSRLTPRFFRNQSPAARYTVAVGSVAIALVVSLALPVVFNSNAFFLFLAAVVISLWYGGYKPGIIATVLSVVGIDYFLLTPAYGFSLDPISIIHLVTFVAIVLLIVSFYAAQRHSEQRFFQQGQWFQVTLASIGDAVIAADIEQHVTFLNTAASDLTGWSLDEATGKPIQEVFHIVNERTRQPVTRFIDRILQEGMVIGLANHTALIAKDGTEYSIADSGAPILDSDGDIIGAVVVFRDVTEELKQEEQLQQNEKRLRTVLQNMPVLLMGLDEAGVIVAWNASCEKATGYRAAEIIGNPDALELLFPGAEDRAHFLEELVQRGQNYHDWEIEIAHKNGNEKCTISWSNVSADFSVQSWASWMIGVDITARKQAQNRTAALQTITAAFSEAVTPQDIADRISGGLFQLVGAQSGTLILRANNSDSFRILNRPNTAADIRDAFLELAKQFPTPWTQVIQTGKPLWIESLKDYGEQFPEMVEQIQPKTGTQAIAVVPLMVEGETIGSIGFSFARPRRFDGLEREFILNIGAQSAQAIQRALLFETEQTALAVAEIAKKRLAYLAEASKVLSSSLEYETTLSNIAALAVPTIADWCRVDIVGEDGKIKIVSIAHVDPEKVSLVSDLQQRFPPNPEAKGGVPQVVRTGTPEFVPEVTDEMIVLWSHGDEYLLNLLRELAFRCILIVPLTVRGETVGAMTFVGTKADRLFSDDDVTLAQEVAQRAAAAIDNAQLYRQAREVAAVEERQRLARDLHDAVTQTLFSANLIAQTLPRMWRSRPEVIPERLDDLYRLNMGALSEMRALLLELRPEGVISSPLPDLIRQLRDTFQARRKMNIDVDVELTRTLPPDTHTVFYRITQEALNNVIKHSKAKQATISLREYPDRVELHIDDDGDGFDGNTVSKGFGLNIMKERAEAVGAILTVASQKGAGTKVVLVWKESEDGE